MRAIPRMTVLVPADANETRRMTRAIAARQGPVYMRITRNDLPDVTPPDARFEWGRPQVTRDGRDVAVFAMGQMVSEALVAADRLESRGSRCAWSTSAPSSPWTRPPCWMRRAGPGHRDRRRAFDHRRAGERGLVRVPRTGNPGRCVGIADEFGQSAHSYRELQEAYGLTAEHIAAACSRWRSAAVARVADDEAGIPGHPEALVDRHPPVRGDHDQLLRPADAAVAVGEIRKQIPIPDDAFAHLNTAFLFTYGLMYVVGGS